MYHLIKYPSALTNRALYGGVYTSDLVVISLVAFVITKLMQGMEVSLIYMVIAAVCTPLYCLLVIRNKYLAKGYFIFLIRKVVGFQKQIIITRNQA